MYITNKIVFLQMQKTGSSHVTNVLRKYAKGKAREKHAQLTDYQAFKDRLIVSSVRNPWDWYVSLWAYGCSGKGGLQKYLTSLPVSELRHAVRSGDIGVSLRSVTRLASQAGRRPDWTALYADAGNTANFRAWLRLMLGPEGQFISKEGYSASPIKAAVGFMTYRFLALTTAFGPWNATGRKLTTQEDVVAFADRHSIATRIMRMETLNADLLDLLHSIGVKVTLDELEAISKTNTSSHRKYTDYYDDETNQLVAKRDRFIVDRFDYRLF